MLLSTFLAHIKKKPETIFILLVFFSLTLKENINSISLILFFGFSVYYGIKKKVNFKKSLKIYAPLLIYFFAFCISALMSGNPELTVKYFLRFLPFFIIPIGFSMLKISKKTLNFSLIGFCYWIFLNAIYSHIIILRKLFSNGDNLYLLFRKDYSYLELGNTINIHPTYYSLFVLTTILILLNSILFSKTVP